LLRQYFPKGTDLSRGASRISWRCRTPSTADRKVNGWKTPVRALRAAQLLGSMGRVGACQDNAALESFFSLLRKNVLNQQRWTSRDELRSAIVFWIERTYHRRRRQDGLGRLTRVEFEILLQTAHAA